MKLSFLKSSMIGQPKESKLVLSLLPVLKNKRTQQFTTLSLTFITLAFFGLFAISPTLSTISDLQKQLDDNTFVNQSLQKKISNITILQQKYTAIQPDLSLVYDALPATPDVDIFVGQVHSLASLQNIQINRMQTFPVDISQQTNAAKYVSYDFSIEVQGDYTQLQKFVAQLTQFNRLIVFSNITISRIGKVDNTFRLVVRGRTYFKGE
ncbi:MAG TPA: type 4a pilus biogenesis protein PilO [Candidatus Saccharimonadales bacterium]|nr:type 4a pilus biogenesis protein PilO [Candidatus Saccharimonadales bacterium]